MKGQKVVWLVVTSVFLLMSLVARPVAADEGADAGAGGDAAKANPQTQAPKDKVRYGTGEISCYKCSSDTDKACTATSPSGDTIQASEQCPKAETIAKDWLSANKLDKIGGKHTEAIFGTGKDATGEDGTGCAFFYSTTSNEVTATIDKGISGLKEKFGITGATPTAVEYVQRNCVTAPASQLDKCVPIANELEGVLTVYLCICSQDKCNEGIYSAPLEGLISGAKRDAKDLLDSKNSAWGNQHDKSRIWITAIILSTYLIL